MEYLRDYFYTKPSLINCHTTKQVANQKARREHSAWVNPRQRLLQLHSYVHANSTEAEDEHSADCRHFMEGFDIFLFLVFL